MHHSESFIQNPDSAKIDSAGKKRVERRSDIINDFRGPDYFIDLHWSEDYILQSEYKSHWSNVCRTSWRTVSGIIFFGHWSNICTYLLDTESICKRVCICYNLFGLLGAGFYPYFQRGKWKYTDLFLLACFAEICDMASLLRMTVSLEVAVDTIVDAALPMIIMNAIGMIVFISNFNGVFIFQDLESSRQIQKMSVLPKNVFRFCKMAG